MDDSEENEPSKRKNHPFPGENGWYWMNLNQILASVGESNHWFKKLIVSFLKTIN